MVSCAPAPKPTQPDELGAVLAINRSLDSQCQDSSPPSQRALRRQISAVGAVCSNSARTDLCGGHRATAVPTATEAFSLLRSGLCQLCALGLSHWLFRQNRFGFW